MLRGAIHVLVAAVVQDDVRGAQDPQARLPGEGLALVRGERLELQVAPLRHVRVEERVEVVEHRDPVLEVALMRERRGERRGAEVSGAEGGEKEENVASVRAETRRGGSARGRVLAVAVAPFRTSTGRAETPRLSLIHI